MAQHVFDQILIPASSVENASSFNTLIDIKLKHWADKELALKSIHVWFYLQGVSKKLEFWRFFHVFSTQNFLQKS